MPDINQPLKKIIVIDDDEDLLFTFNYWLRRKGYLTITFNDYRDLYSTIESFKPDLVLIDVNLKSKDGREICRHIKQHLDYSNPCVMFSMHDYSATDFSEWQADGFIQKGFDHLALIRAMEKHLV